MGGNHSNQFDEKLFNSQWERKQGTSFDGRTIWVSKSQPSRQIQEYPVYADTEDEIDTQRDLFSLRKDSAQLIAATHLKETVKGGLCSNSAQGRLFLQKIPLKLEALQHIPFPDILHVHFNALTGYKRLNKAVGPFRPGSEQIGFNDSGEAKVWMNMDFSASAPASKEISQVAMVRNLLQIIEDSTDIGTTPRENPSIMNYIYKNSNDVTFDQALNSIKDFANMYNNGVIPKNLECLQRVGIENISKSLVQPTKVQSSKSQQQFVNQQPLISQQPLVNQQSFVNQQQPFAQYRPLQLQQQGIQSVPVYPKPFVAQNYISIPQPILPVPVTQQSQPIQAVQQSQSIQSVQPSRYQFVQQSQPIRVVQQSQPIQFVQQSQPIQFIQQPVQSVSVAQPAQVLASSDIKVQNDNKVDAQSQNQGQQRFIQSQVQTVRPIQAVFTKTLEEQRVIQQVIRTPQGPIQIIPQSPIIGQTVANSLSQQGSRINQQQTVYNQVTVQREVYTEVTPVRQVFEVNQDLNIQNQLPEEPKFSELAKQSEIQLLNQLQKQTSRSQFQQQAQSYRQNLVSNETNEGQSLPKLRNFIDSNTMNVGIDRVGTQQYQSYSTSPQRSEVQQKNDNLGSSKFNDISLEDGKSSEALLAQLRGFSSNKKDIPTYNAYEFSSNSYTSSNTRTYDFTTNYSTTKGTTDQSQDLYGIFNKYAQGNKWDENIEMKYSMTKNLYDQPAATNAEKEDADVHGDSEPAEGQFSYNQQDIEKFQQEGEYHVDYDPEILADIERLKS